MDADWPLGLAAIGDEAGVALEVQIAALSSLGWRAIELRTIDGKALDSLTKPELGIVANRLRESDIAVCALSSNIGAWGRTVTTPLALDVDELDRLELTANMLGCRRIRVMSWQNDGLTDRHWRDEAIRRMRALAGRAAQLDLVLLHENCSGWAGQSETAMRQLVEAVDSEHLGLLLDIGNCVAYGQDPVAFTEALADRVSHVHIKDAICDRDGAHFVRPGTGQARIADCLRILRLCGYRGVLSLEPHLHTAPHRGAIASGTDAVGDFIACGQALESLVAETWGSHNAKLDGAAAEAHNLSVTERSDDGRACLGSTAAARL